MPAALSLHRRLPLSTRQAAWLLLLIGCVPSIQAQESTKPAETDPIVISIQARNPQTPNELAAAVQMLLDVGRSDLAKDYLARLDAAAADDDQWFDLARTFGSQFLFRLTSEDGIQPQGRAVAEKMIAASQRVANDPVRLDSLTRRLADPEIVYRSEALADLRRLGEVGAAAILNALSDSGRAADAPFLRGALAQFGESAREPILGGIRSTHPQLKLESIRAARHHSSSDVVAALLRPALQPDPDDAVQAMARESLATMLPALPNSAAAVDILSAQVQRGLSHEPLRHELFPANRTIWRSHPETQQLVQFSRPETALRRMQAAESAEDLLHIAPADPAVQMLYLLALTEATKMVRGFEVPITQTTTMVAISQAGAQRMEEVLAEAMDRDLAGAAMSACEAIGELGTPQQLSGSGVSPLVRATRFHDARVQFAACQAIIKIDPPTSFPGSSDVAQAMVDLARAEGRTKVLVAFPQIDEAQFLAAAIEQLGFRAEPIHDARQLLATATSDADTQLVLVSDRMSPSASEIVDHLRSHPQTRRMPIGLMYSGDEKIIAAHSGRLRQDVRVHLVLDTRKFPKYADLVDEYFSASGDRLPLLVVVKPGDTDLAFGWSGRDSQVRYLELPENAPLIWKGLPEHIREIYHLERSPVCFVVQAIESGEINKRFTGTLVLDPDHWQDWAQWTRLLHDSPRTNAVDVILANDSGMRTFETLAKVINEPDQETVPTGEVLHLFQQVVGAISTERALQTSYIDTEPNARADRVEREHPFVVAMPATQDIRLIARQMDRLANLLNEVRVTPAEQQYFAEQATRWLEKISDQPARYPFWDLAGLDRSIVQAAQTNHVSPAICNTLGNLGTAQSQQQLLDIVGRTQVPVETRAAAVEAFKRAIERRGIMLTSDQIRQQYDRYNASRTLPAETQQLFAAVLDAMEAK
jgi:hypothetical protein